MRFQRWGILVVGAVMTALVLVGCTSASAPTGGTSQGTETATPTPQKPALSLQDLLTAPVPSLCEHEAGTLADGKLPGIAESEGFVALDEALLADITAGAAESTQAVIGEDAEGAPFIAAHVACNRGGVSWPGQVVIWDDSLTPVAQIMPAELTGGDRERIVSLALAKGGGVDLKWLAPAASDAACCYNISAEASFTVDVAAKKATVKGETVKGRGTEQLRSIFEAAVAGAPAPAITMEDRMFEGIVSLVQRGVTFDLEALVCREAPLSGELTSMEHPIVCVVPTKTEDEAMLYVAYPKLDGEWGKYSFTREWEMYPAS